MRQTISGKRHDHFRRDRNAGRLQGHQEEHNGVGCAGREAQEYGDKLGDHSLQYSGRIERYRTAGYGAGFVSIEACLKPSPHLLSTLPSLQLPHVLNPAVMERLPLTVRLR